MNKYIVLFALLCLAASAFALSLPIDKSKLKFPKIPKCYCIRAPCHCGGQWDEESDIAWVPVAIWAGKALGAGALGAAGAHAYDKIFRRKDDVESEFPLGAIFTAYNLYKKFKKDNVESDFGKFFKKIGGVVKKGVSLYGKAKGLGFFDDAESDREFRDQLIAKLKDRVKSKLQKQLKEDSISKKLCVLTKLRAKPFCASRAKVESDKINFKNLFSQKNLEKAIGIYKAIKGDAEESDAEFLSKLKNWWNNKGKGLFEKGKNLFNKGKEIYAILKNKGEETESEKINWSGVKKYLTPENLQKAVDIWKILKGKDAVESDFYGQVAKFLAQKGVEQLGKLGYNKIFRRDDAEEQAPAEKPKRKPKTEKKPKSEKKGVTLKGLVAKLRKQRAEKEGKPEKKSGKWAMFEKLMKRFKKNKKSTEEGQKSEKPKRKFDLKSLIAKLSKQKKQKKEKKEKKVEEPQQVNDQASG